MCCIFVVVAHGPLAFFGDFAPFSYMMSGSGGRQRVDKKGYRRTSQHTREVWPKKRYDYGHESGVRSIVELRKDDLSAMESIHMPQKGEWKLRSTAYAPLFDLYSMMVVGGRCNTTRILSLLKTRRTTEIRQCAEEEAT